MGYLIYNNFCNCDRDKDGHWIKEEIIEGLSFSNQFWKGVVFRKASVSFKCFSCEENRPKNTKYLGDYYQRICVDCAMKWIEESIKSFNEAIEILEHSKKELLTNTEKWKKEMILGAIIGDKNEKGS